MALAQELYAEHANSRRQAKVFEIGDRVYLSTRNLSLEGPTRFQPRSLGLFSVTTKHSDVAYTLHLPAENADPPDVPRLPTEGCESLSIGLNHAQRNDTLNPRRYGTCSLGIEYKYYRGFPLVSMLSRT